jgi:hypothetical protein
MFPLKKFIFCGPLENFLSRCHCIERCPQKQKYESCCYPWKTDISMFAQLGHSEMCWKNCICNISLGELKFIPMAKIKSLEINQLCIWIKKHGNVFFSDWLKRAWRSVCHTSNKFHGMEDYYLLDSDSVHKCSRRQQWKLSRKVTAIIYLSWPCMFDLRKQNLNSEMPAYASILCSPKQGLDLIKNPCFPYQV